MNPLDPQSPAGRAVAARLTATLAAISLELDSNPKPGTPMPSPPPPTPRPPAGPQQPPKGVAA